VLTILRLAEQITNGSTEFAAGKSNRFITFNYLKSLYLIERNMASNYYLPWRNIIDKIFLLT
jgi:hypothetical protein